VTNALWVQVSSNAYNANHQVIVNYDALNELTTYTYDGSNLTNDGTRSLGYDMENQLTNVTVAGQWREDFLYDGLNRRRITWQYIWQGGTWALTNETRFIYDGNVVIQEWDSNNVAQVTYTRGLDLSGSLQGAGGIGGLLALSQLSTNNPQHFYYHADGNGNITSLMDTNQYMVARYLYDPFGKLLGKWGNLADANVYRFSSKEYDANSGLYYYLRRFYDPNLQRWPNRDPIKEKGGLNLYGFAVNNPLNQVDALGLLVEVYSYPFDNYRHAYLKITPDNPGCFSQIAMQKDPNGKQFFTIGGHPGGFLSHYLYGLMNEHDDVTAITGGTALNKGQVNGGHGDTVLINELLSAYNAYKNNGALTYTSQPSQNDQEYNCNSYASGIIDSVGAQGPDLSDVPQYVGWDNPVPAAAFLAQ